MHVFKALLRQPFQRAKWLLHPALTAVIARLQHRADSPNGTQFPMSQSPAQLWEHDYFLTDYQVWVCYRVATHQLNLFFPGRELDTTCKRHRTCVGQHEGLLHIIWDCDGVAKSWAYIISQWTRSVVSPTQLLLYQQAALLRAAMALPSRVRADISRLFPDTADLVGRAWKRVWWIACSVCVTTLWTQRNRSIHKQERTSPENEVAEVKQVLLRQLRAVAMKEQRRDKDVSNGVYLRLATEMFQDTIVDRWPEQHSPSNPQETSPGVPERLRTFQKSCIA